MEAKFANKIFSILCALSMMVIIFQNVSADYDTGDDIDIFIDHFGNNNIVWREEVNGTHQVFYSHEIVDDIYNENYLTHINEIINDNIIFDDGHLVLQNCTVNGNLMFSRAQVTIEDCQINGIIKQTYGLLDIQTSSVNGNLEVKDSNIILKKSNVQGHVKIKQNADENYITTVTGNAIEGSLDIKSGTCYIVGNYINGNFYVKDPAIIQHVLGNNITGNTKLTNNDVGFTGLQITNSSFDVMYPQISIDPVSGLSYIGWISGENNDEIWYCGSDDQVEWTDIMFGGKMPFIEGNPGLDMIAYNYSLSFSWIDNGELLILPDLDGDYIPDNEDLVPLYFNSDAELLHVDAISTNSQMGITVGVDYEANETEAPVIQQTSPLEMLPGSLSPYAQVTIPYLDGFEVEIKFKYDSLNLPSYVNEKYLRLYAYDGVEWRIIGYSAQGDSGGVNLDRGYVWGITNHLSIITIADSSVVDLDKDGVPDIWDTEAVAVEEPDRLTLFTGSSVEPEVYISPTDVIHVVWLDTREGLTRLFHKVSSNNGESWSPDTPITDGNYLPYLVDVAGFGEEIHVVFNYPSSNSAEPWKTKIMYMKSTDGGQSWNEPVEIGIGNTPSITVNDCLVYVAYQKTVVDPELNFLVGTQVTVIRSMDDGDTWNSGIEFSGSSTKQSSIPKISASGNNVYLLWSRPEGVFNYVYSSDSGRTWTSIFGPYPEITYTVESEGKTKNIFFDIIGKGDNLYLTWDDFRDGQYEIYYKGWNLVDWTDDIRVTYSDSESLTPSFTTTLNDVSQVTDEFVFGPAIGGETGSISLLNTHIISLQLTLDTGSGTSLLEEGVNYVLDYNSGEISLNLGPFVTGWTFYADYSYSTFSNDKNMFHLTWIEYGGESKETYYMTFNEISQAPLLEEHFLNDYISYGGQVTGVSTDLISSNGVYETLSESNTMISTPTQWSGVYGSPTFWRLTNQAQDDEKTCQFEFNLPTGISYNLVIEGYYSGLIPDANLRFYDSTGTKVILGSSGATQIKTAPITSSGGIYILNGVEWGYGTYYLKRVTVEILMNYDLLEYTWVTSTPSSGTLSSNTLNMEYIFTPDSEGDSVLFSYSTDEQNYINMFEIDEFSNNIITYSFPPSVQGTIYIRIADTNRNFGTSDPISISIDYLIIDCLIQTEELVAENPRLISLTDGKDSYQPAIALDSLGNSYCYWQDAKDGENEINGFSEYTTTGSSINQIIETIMTIPPEDFNTYDFGENITELQRSTLVNKLDFISNIYSVGDLEEANNILTNDIVPFAASIISNESTLGSEIPTLLSEIDDGVKPTSTDIPNPPAAMLVDDTERGGEIRVSWSASVGASSDYRYRIYRTTVQAWHDNGWFNLYEMVAENLPISSTPYDDTGLTNGITYYYAMTAYNAYGESSFYGGIEGTYDTPTLILSPPAIDFTEPTNGAIDVDSDTINSFIIHFTNAMKDDSITLSMITFEKTDGTPVPSCAIHSPWPSSTELQLDIDPIEIEDGATYFVQLADGAKDEMNQNLGTCYWTFTTSSIYPYVSSWPGVSGEIDIDAPLAIEFSEPMKTTTFTSGRVTFSPSIYHTASWSGETILQYINGLLDDGTEYTLTISGDVEDSDGDKLLNGAGDSTIFRTKLTAPNLKVTVTSNEFIPQMNWISDSTLDHYDIYMKLASSGTWNLMGTTTNNEYVIDYGFSVGNLYNIKVVAYNDIGICAESSQVNVEIAPTTYVLDVGSGRNEYTRQDSTMQEGLFLFPNQAANYEDGDGWSVARTDGGHIYRTNPPVAESGAPNQPFMLNIGTNTGSSYPNFEEHIDYLFTITYFVSYLNINLEQYGPSGWEPIGNFESSRGNYNTWDTKSFLINHNNFKDYISGSSDSWLGENYLFKFSNWIRVDKIEITPIKYYADISIDGSCTDFSIHSPGISLSPSSWSWDTTSSAMGVSGSYGFVYLNIPSVSASYIITADVWASSSTVTIEQFESGGTYPLTKRLFSDIIDGWTQISFACDSSVYFDYVSSDDSYSVLLRFSNNAKLRSIFVELDMDSDSMLDNWEIDHFGSITVSDGTTSYDSDNLPDLDEYLLGTDPTNPDTDGDNSNDGIDAFPFDIAASVDTDGDGLPDDWNEGYTSSTLNPELTVDTDDDNDGMPDIWEDQYGLNPIDASDRNIDSFDGDGISNYMEYYYQELKGVNGISPNVVNNRYAILIGIDTYQNIGGLSGCINDVNDWKSYLLSIGWDSANIHTLTDSQATESAITNLISTVKASATSNDLIIFHQSSHGGTYGTSGSQLCCYDSAADGSSSGNLRDTEFDTAWSGCQADLFIMLDSCHSGEMDDVVGSNGNRYMVTACSQSGVSHESPSLGNGVWTYYFLRGLSSGASGHDDMEGNFDWAQQQQIDWLTTNSPTSVSEDTAQEFDGSSYSHFYIWKS